MTRTLGEGVDALARLGCGPLLHQEVAEAGEHEAAARGLQLGASQVLQGAEELADLLLLHAWVA